jgi:hypothetical protein
LPVPLVGVTGSGGKAGGPLTAFDVEGEDILLSPPPDSNRFFFFFFKKKSTIYYAGLNHSLWAPMPGYCTKSFAKKRLQVQVLQFTDHCPSLYSDAPSPIADKQVAKVQEYCCPESQHLPPFLPLACASSLSH